MGREGQHAENQNKTIRTVAVRGPLGDAQREIVAHDLASLGRGRLAVGGAGAGRRRRLGHGGVGSEESGGADEKEGSN